MFGPEKGGEDGVVSVYVFCVGVSLEHRSVIANVFKYISVFVWMAQW